MRTSKQIEEIKEYEFDIKDAEENVKKAENELAEANEWLMKMKVNHAEQIIKLNNYLKSL